MRAIQFSLFGLLLSLVLAGCQSSWNVPSVGKAFSGKPAEVALPGGRVWPDEIQIKAVLEDQKNAWNEGDIDAFMQGYWQSEDLRFVSGDAVYTGWQATIDRYYQTYPDRAAMGQLEFSGLEVMKTSEEIATVNGLWKLQRANDTPNGAFVLEFRKFGDSWLITSDTTSSAGA